MLPELIELAGGAEHVVTIADFGGAQEHGVTFSSGDAASRAVHALGEIGELIESGRFSLPVAQTFPLAEVAEAHRVSEQGHVRGKLVCFVGSTVPARSTGVGRGATMLAVRLLPHRRSRPGGSWPPARPGRPGAGPAAGRASPARAPARARPVAAAMAGANPALNAAAEV